ncbi:MAG: hypothetical protein IT463_06880 [Planctomycetes bacterium]|nr:hypothetical protein [Planctomycetota bacterium]
MLLLASPADQPARGVTAPARIPVAAQAAPAEQPAPPAAEPVPEGALSAPDSEVRMTNLNPIDLMSGTLEARQRGDQAWLARAMASTAGKTQLVQDDLLTAYRQFLWRSASGLWSKIEGAWAQRAYQLEEEGDAATLVFEVGGAMGQLRVSFVKIGEAWYFAGM